MKNILYTAILVVISTISFAQKELKVSVPKQEASYVGGQEAMTSYLTKTMKVPKDKKTVEGTTYVRFTIDESGNVIDAKVLKGFDDKLDAIAVGAIKSMPKWIPALDKDNKSINSEIVLPIKFKKQD